MFSYVRACVICNSVGDNGVRVYDKVTNYACIYRDPSCSCGYYIRSITIISPLWSAMNPSLAQHDKTARITGLC